MWPFLRKEECKKGTERMAALITNNNVAILVVHVLGNRPEFSPDTYLITVVT